MHEVLVVAVMVDWNSSGSVGGCDAVMLPKSVPPSRQADRDEWMCMSNPTDWKSPKLKGLCTGVFCIDGKRTSIPISCCATTCYACCFGIVGVSILCLWYHGSC